jgi:hypothetical protein
MPSIAAAQFNGISWRPFPVPLVPPTTQVTTSLACIAPTDGSAMRVVYGAADGQIYLSYYAGNPTHSGEWGKPTGISVPGNAVPDAAPAVAETASGTTYVVYPSDGTLWCIINEGTAISTQNDGISEGTSPALVMYNGFLYCMYQSYDSGGELWCMASYDSIGQTWKQINPDGADFYGLSGSPSIALAPGGSVGYVMYQGYDTSGALSGSAFTAGEYQQLTFQKFINNIEGAGLPMPYMSGSPSATISSGGNLCVAMAPPSGAGPIRVVRFAGSGWVLPSPGSIAAGTSPTLVAYGNSLVCLWLTD